MWWPWLRRTLMVWAVQGRCAFPRSWRPGLVRREPDWQFVPERGRDPGRRCPGLRTANGPVVWSGSRRVFRRRGALILPSSLPWIRWLLRDGRGPSTRMQLSGLLGGPIRSVRAVAVSGLVAMIRRMRARRAGPCGPPVARWVWGRISRCGRKLGKTVRPMWTWRASSRGRGVLVMCRVRVVWIRRWGPGIGIRMNGRRWMLLRIRLLVVPEKGIRSPKVPRSCRWSSVTRR